MARKSPDYERVRQNLIYLHHLVQRMVDAGDVDLALTCTHENIATAKALSKLSSSDRDHL